MNTQSTTGGKVQTEDPHKVRGAATREDASPMVAPGIRYRFAALTAGFAGLVVIVVTVALYVRWLFPSYEPVVSCLRDYAEAQFIYHEVDWKGNGQLQYARPYGLLATQKDACGNAICLVDNEFVAAAGIGGIPRYGYRFREMKTYRGCEIPWSDSFALCATPASYGRPYRYTFFIDERAYVFMKDLGRSQFIDDVPSDFLEAGWSVYESPVRAKVKRPRISAQSTVQGSESPEKSKNDATDRQNRGE